MVEFLLNDEIDKLVSTKQVSYSHKRDLRLTSKFIKWMQVIDNQSHQLLLNSLDNTIRSQYRSWLQMNEYKLDLTFEESKSITTKEWLEIRESNTNVKYYYDNMDE